jgi:hypothetical protein
MTRNSRSLETAAYCTFANAFHTLPEGTEVSVEPKSKTPLALAVDCPECTRTFKSLPRKKDGTVWIALHREGAPVQLGPDAATGAQLDADGPARVYEPEVAPGEEPSPAAAALAANDAEAVAAHQARLAEDPTVQEALAAIADAAQVVEVATERRTRRTRKPRTPAN